MAETTSLLKVPWRYSLGCVIEYRWVAPSAERPVPHDHAEYVSGCFRCELGQDESAPVAGGNGARSAQDDERR